MLASEPFIEKEFEIWPGRLLFAAAGDGAREALDAGMDMARDVSSALIADAELLASGSPDVLPRGQAGRLALEAHQAVRDALPVEDLPPALAALPGAVCDVVLGAMRERSGAAVTAVWLDGVMALHQDAETMAPSRTGLPPVLHEFSVALGTGLQGGVAMGGIRSSTPTSGLADLVAVQARSAGLAGLVAAALADAVEVVSAARETGGSRDKLLQMGWAGRRMTRCCSSSCT
ncbi:MAG: hypothetical protein WD034_06910, partial [Parvibaculum sp.]